MESYMMISSDSHVIEPPHLWTDGIETDFKHRAPKVEADPEGDYWYIDGMRTNSFQGGAQAGVRFEHPEELEAARRWEEVMPGGYVPEECVKDNEQDGIEISVLYPTEGLDLYSVPDGNLLSAIFRAYNNWLSDFCATNPRQLKGIAMLNIDNPDEAVSELERVSAKGLPGAMIPVHPPEERSYDSNEYDVLWNAAERLGMPLSLHVGTNRATDKQGPDKVQVRQMKLSQLAAIDYFVRVSLGNLILSGVFERFPNLKVICVEHELAWIPSFLERLDYTYSQRAAGIQLERFKDGMIPSDFFHRNIYASFQEDGLGIKDRDIIGIDNLMWGSDYPHTESTYPRSVETVTRILDGIPEDEKRKILRDNAVRVYGLT
ncbi:amidohydrolase [SAR202 cluster bacterium AD-804-J14_MRT_500m]|nr:amidohydrolase [SAR202 cluster bacterium AD-804-J14_MRT_500m]